MLSRTVTRQLLRPAHVRPAVLAAAPSSAATTGTARAPASFVSFSSQFSTAVRRPTPSSPSPRLTTPTVPFQQRRLLSDHTREAIDRAVHSAPVVLFMKGTPELPQCGFSRAAIQILGLQGVDPDKFAAFNVLEDAELRAGIKEYSDWPTIPQLYVDKEFVGGCDILVSMHQSGELAKLFDEKKVLIAVGEAEGEGEAAATPKE
ncbi:monothiol glutaredoxin grx5 [Sporothrix curviconia]|uniref:Monothiol glutaredoxin grx5 n=1 Tax=Sporothrix curviconia TaxID=1260050 RepID=A0ABP0BWE4_9PEZI